MLCFLYHGPISLCNHHQHWHIYPSENNSYQYYSLRCLWTKISSECYIDLFLITIDLDGRLLSLGREGFNINITLTFICWELMHHIRLDWTVVAFSLLGYIQYRIVRLKEAGPLRVWNFRNKTEMICVWTNPWHRSWVWFFWGCSITALLWSHSAA